MVKKIKKEKSLILFSILEMLKSKVLIDNENIYYKIKCFQFRII